MPELSFFAPIKDVVLFVLAIWGAGLSTYSFLASRRKDKRSIQVKVSSVMLTYGDKLGPPIAKLEAINIGQRNVTISTLTFETPTKGRMFPLTQDRYPGLSDTKLPITLGDGESAQMYISYKEIGQALLEKYKGDRVNIVPVCIDSTGGEHRGEAWDVDANELIRMR